MPFENEVKERKEAATDGGGVLEHGSLVGHGVLGRKDFPEGFDVVEEGDAADAVSEGGEAFPDWAVGQVGEGGGGEHEGEAEEEAVGVASGERVKETAEAWEVKEG